MMAQEGAGKHKGTLEKRRSLERVASLEPGEGTEGCQPPPELPPVVQPVCGVSRAGVALLVLARSSSPGLV